MAKEITKFSEVPFNNWAYPSYLQFHDYLKEYNLTPEDVISYVNTLYVNGRLDKALYSKTINSLEKYEEKYADDKSGLSRAWFEAWTSLQNQSDMAKLYDAMAENLDVYDNVNKMTIDELAKGVRDGIMANTPTISGPAAPNYNVVRTGAPAGYPVGDVPLWTGQELADLNNTNWDPNHYYDLLKQGTEAEVNRAQFGIEQADQASRTLNSREKASYLDSIRNAKAEAIAAGATKGAHSANEMLASQDSIRKYADKQNKVRQNSYESIMDSLLADASAKITAREYFDNLAAARYNEGIQFYANDTDAQGQELLTDAELHSADIQDRAQADYANALMNQYYNQNRATADVAGGAINGAANEYAWLFNTFAKANNNNIPKTVSDMDSYIFNRYTGQNNLKNFYNAVNK